MTLAGSITRLQSLALQSSSDLRFAPDYPVDDAAVFPFCVAHLKSGSGQPDDASNVRELYTIGVDFYVSRLSLKQSYQQIGAFTETFHQRLAGDPTLAGNCQTVDFTNSAAPFTVRAATWNKQPAIAAMFDIVIKIFATPLASS